MVALEPNLVALEPNQLWVLVSARTPSTRVYATAATGQPATTHTPATATRTHVLAAVTTRLLCKRAARSSRVGSFMKAVDSEVCADKGEKKNRDRDRVSRVSVAA